MQEISVFEKISVFEIVQEISVFGPKQRPAGPRLLAGVLAEAPSALLFAAAVAGGRGGFLA